MDLFLTSLISLFSIINPLGTIPLFVSLTKEKTIKEKTNIIIWTTVYVFIILIISFFLGKYLLVFFGISLPSLKIAGGLIIASSGFALLTGSFSKHKGLKKKVKEDAFSRSEISLTPLAMPMLAGPGTISLLITYNQVYTKLNDKIILYLSILTISILIFILLKSSDLIVKILGDSGINALSRIIGFVLIAIGVESVSSAIISLSK